jgi:ABC-2 type transport system ATP-binding protein
VPPEDVAWFASRGPGSLVSKIRIPTLLVEGTADTLFTLHEAIVNYGILKANHVPLKMLWFCGGHGACTTAHDPSGLVESRVIAWLKRYVMRNPAVNTGPGFEWLTDTGDLLHSAAFPPPARPALTADGSGTLAINPGDNGVGTPISAAPAANAINVPFGAPPAGAQYAGEPTLTMTYSGTALPTANTHVFAQIVNTHTGQVLGNQSTPIPVALDGRSHTITRKLEGVATTAVAGTTYILQITSGSSLYVSQRSAGVLNVSRVHAAMPGVQPAS